MSYTAWEECRIKNRRKNAIDAPHQPMLFTDADKYATNLEKECLAFIRDNCEGLRFDNNYADCCDLEGNSIGKKQIPYNMEKDTDRLCLERAIHKFMKTGVAEDAFDIYFCYIELFIGKYGKAKGLVEMLAEFEKNASALLMKHRDHYSHSVYVFILGLAIFRNNAYFREQYQEVHMSKQNVSEQESACHFLKYWGLTALFHDIGYPFELPFEQVKSYFGDTIKSVPFISYKGMEEYNRITEAEDVHFRTLYNRAKGFESSSDIIASNIELHLGKKYGCTESYLKSEVLNQKPTSPEAFNGYMDHAVFSGLVLYRQLVEIIGVDEMDKAHIDALSAITLHNSMFKFSIRNGMPLEVKYHPLAYMLMLCDELQCWDRTAYGRNSRLQLHPMGFDMRFDQNVMKAIYFYDSKYEKRKTICEGTIKKMLSAEGIFTSECKFVKDLTEIISINAEKKGSIQLEIEVEFEKVENMRKLNTYLSNSNFVHLYNFAVLVHGRRKKRSDPEVTFEELEDYFNESTLEYQLSVIERTKNYAKYLDAVGMFYTDRIVNYEMVSEEDIEDEIELIMGEMEHQRWNNEKLEMGWTYGTGYITEGTEDKALRERTRTHSDIVTYEELTEPAKNKDKEPLKEMLKLLAEVDGIRVYRIPRSY